MDAHPLTYQVSAREARREGRVDETGASGLPQDPRPAPLRDPRGVRADAGRDARLLGRRALAARRARLVRLGPGLTNFRIARRASEFPNGCFRGAVALAADVAAGESSALRFRAFTRLPGKGEAAAAEGLGQRAARAASTRCSCSGPTTFPGARLFSWQGRRAARARRRAGYEIPAQPPAPPEVTMLKGTAREAAAEFLGTFVLIVVRHGGRRPGRAVRGGQRRLPLDQPRVGTRRDDGGVRVGGRLGRAPEPGRHGRAGRAPRLPVGQGAALHRRAARRRVLRRRAHLRHLSRGLRALRRRRRARSPARKARRASSRPTRSRS